jgi:hypothetical protein
MIPQVTLTKANGNTGVVRPTDLGILALVASSYTGTQNQPAQYTRPEDVQTDFGPGRLPSFSAYVLAETGNPVLAVKPATATPGAYGSITQTSTGTVATSDVTILPYDEWNVVLACTSGGTVGTGPISYTYSLDGGVTTSAVQALGTATSITIPNTGVKVNLTSALWKTGETISFTTTPPYATTTDLTNTLEALRTTKLPWDGMLIDAIATSTIVSQLDTWLAARELEGVYRFAVVNVRRRNAGETEAQYLTALQSVLGSTTSDRVVVCADGADMVEFFQGVDIPRPTSLYVASRAEAQDIAVEPAYVALGPLDNCSIDDVRGNPKYHDEQIYPGLDALRLTTLRSFPRQTGVFICNTNLISSPTSDYQLLPHLRVMNRACEIAYQVLTTQLSKGVAKSPKVGPNGARYISEPDAARIEGLVNAALRKEMKNRVTDIAYVMRRDDDISSNAGATITGDLQIVDLAYVKRFKTVASFVKAIAA